MLKTGLVSVTFRNLSAEEVVEVAKKAGLDGIEWGEGAHIPSGDVEAAKNIRKMTEDAGLSVFSYGSYFRPGDCNDVKAEFKPVLDVAVALGAKTIRVWAGSKWSWYADEAYNNKVIEETKVICRMAEEFGINISYEFHGWSLTDNKFSAVDTWDRVQREDEKGKVDNIRLHWQPNFAFTSEDNVKTLQYLIAHNEIVHVFTWEPDGTKLPMADGVDDWKKFIDIMKKKGGDRYLMMEFVKDGTPEQLYEDVKVLKSLL